MIERAFIQRLRFLVDGAAPYTAIAGAVRAGLGNREWGERMRSIYPLPARLPERARDRWSPYRPPVYGWRDTDPASTESFSGDIAQHKSALGDFLKRCKAFLDEHAPVGELGTPGTEIGLARICWALSRWEHTYYEGRIPSDVASALRRVACTADDLRRLAPDAAVNDLVELMRVFHHARVLNEWRDWTGVTAGPLGMSSPTIVPRWADGHLLVGNTLVTVKAPVLVDKVDVIARWLWRMLALVWLDTENLYGIRVVALYLARHGVSETWGATTFADMLLGGTGRADRGAREEFLTLARRVIREEGGQPPPAWQVRRPRLASHVDP
ncbi:hypothetical protein [Amycolatopsis anabasis]|uniref:hypothetical protein n=1 Tax=Amycolatopsis anabasis TaxID=1840409 RepID=UPI00131C48FE|nr:hypothetical protein [Amycolatopsis anabasis]